MATFTTGYLAKDGTFFAEREDAELCDQINAFREIFNNSSWTAPGFTATTMTHWLQAAPLDLLQCIQSLVNTLVDKKRYEEHEADQI